jgi:3-oxoacyl-[acyl-carrier-protein] synthase II
MTQTRQRVAVTGLGLMCGLGLNLESCWRNLAAGRVPVRRWTQFEPGDLASPFGVELPDGADEIFDACIKTRNRRQMTRATMMAVATAGMAIHDAGLSITPDNSSRIGAVIGCTGTGYAYSGSEADPNRILKNMASAPAAWVSLKYKISGPSFAVSTACSSGAYALSSAMHLILSGRCDAVVCGAADSAINYQDIEGFCSLMALSNDIENLETASRPFDLKRNGFVMGEGAGMLVVESEEHAKRRGAGIHAFSSIPGLASEAYNILSPRPGGLGMAEAMRDALVNAGLDTGDIDYINAHGTSTPHNDLYETQAIKDVFGARAYRIPVSSTKSQTGHCLSGAAGVEAVICCKALKENLIPATMNLKNPDPALDLDYVPDVPRKAVLRHVMSNSFAFGGHNGVCVFSHTGDC